MTKMQNRRARLQYIPSSMKKYKWMPGDQDITYMVLYAVIAITLLQEPTNILPEGKC